MGTESKPVEDVASPRASTVSVLATMAVIAVVAAMLVLLPARLSRGAGNDGDQADAEVVPATLVGGIEPTAVPQEVAAAFDLPVVGATNLDELPPQLAEDCANSFGEIDWDDGQPTIEWALATTDGIEASLVGTGSAAGMDFGKGAGGEEAESYRLSCSGSPSDGGGWMTQGGGMEPVFDGQPPMSMGGGSFCCDDNGMATATGAVDVPAGAAWGVQDRAGWYLAYPVGKRQVINVTWKYREGGFGGGGGPPPQSKVTFVDAQGGILAEAFTGGQF